MGTTSRKKRNPFARWANELGANEADVRAFLTEPHGGARGLSPSQPERDRFLRSFSTPVEAFNQYHDGLVRRFVGVAKKSIEDPMAHTALSVEERPAFWEWHDTSLAVRRQKLVRIWIIDVDDWKPLMRKLKGTEESSSQLVPTNRGMLHHRWRPFGGSERRSSRVAKGYLMLVRRDYASKLPRLLWSSASLRADGQVTRTAVRKVRSRAESH